MQQIDEICLSVCNQVAHASFFVGRACKVMYVTGCRVGEIADPNRWELSADEAYLLLTTEKTNQIRQIQIDEDTEYLANAIKSNQKHLLRLSTSKIRMYINRAVNQINPSKGNKDISAHIFRHNKARLLKAQGYSIAQIADYFKISPKVVTTYTDSYINT